MIIFIANLITRIFGVNVTDALKYARYILIGFLALIILIFVVSLYSCFKKEPKIDQESINKINTANEKQRKEELEKIIKENTDVIKTVDERNTISEETVERQEIEIENKIKEADKKIQEAKSQKRDVTEAELKCILIPENCQ